MNILIVAGCDLSINSSANLCHTAYIKGLLSCGDSIDLLTAGDSNIISNLIDNNLNVFSYNAISMYEKLRDLLSRENDNNTIKSTENTTNVNNVVNNNQTNLFTKIKRAIHYMYGPHEINITWARKASHFSSDKTYDLVISLAYPPVSHLVAYKLISKKQIKTNRWIQLWEDPWCSDIIFRSANSIKRIHRAEKEEARLLSLADEILYVSPITLENQKAAYPDSANKMRWLPVPSYYSVTTPNKIDGKVFGYFGDYSSQIRNLKPFYEAAIETDVTVNICGSSDEMFSSTNSITVRPRISLDELRPIEDNTNVLVFLSNLHGGQIPGKIYQYAATDKIVLFILDGTENEINILKDFFGKYNRFVFCNNNKDSISKAISDICNGKYDKYNTPLDIFTPEKIVHKILNNESM